MQLNNLFRAIEYVARKNRISELNKSIDKHMNNLLTIIDGIRDNVSVSEVKKNLDS